MGPLFNPITLILALLLFLALLVIVTLPIPLVSIAIGAAHYYIRNRKHNKARASESILVAAVVGAMQIIMLVPLAGPGFLVSLFIACLMMIL